MEVCFGVQTSRRGNLHGQHEQDYARQGHGQAFPLQSAQLCQNYQSCHKRYLEQRRDENRHDNNARLHD